ncbi:MAG: hypothetical protein J0L84_03790 [Verrucomicrobia bacterium]|nr:hypothetical protein [Verrucomicrobiota bacterium]
MNSSIAEFRNDFRTFLYKPLTVLSLLLTIGSATGNNPPACVPLPESVSAWFPGEDTRDVLGVEPGALLGDARIGPGKWGNAFQFDGANDAISVPGTAGLDLQQFTVECWMRRSTTARVGSEAGAVLMGGNGGAWVFAIYAEGGLYLGKVGVASSAPRGAIVDTLWHHVAATRVGSLVLFYVDGVSVGEAPLGETFGPSATYGIGGLSQPFNNITYGFDGFIDEMTVHDRPLGAAEIAGLAGATAPRCLDDVLVAVTGSPKRVPQGSAVAITAEVRNRSTKRTGPLRVHHNAPSGFEFLGADLSQGTVAADGSDVVAQLGFLEAGASAELTFRWRTGTNQSGIVSHRLALDSTPEDTIPANNLATISYLLTGECIPALPGLRFWWRGENSPEEAISGIEGTASPALKYTEGLVGDAFSFRENLAVLSQPQSSPLPLGDFSFEAWVRRANGQAVSPTGAHCFLLAAPQGAMGFGIVPDGRLYFYSQPTDSTFSQATVTDTAWHHIALSKAGADVRFFLDGAPAGTATYPTGVRQLEYLTLGGITGSDPNNTYSFLGDVDEAALYTRALTPAEVAVIAGAGPAGRCSNDLKLSVRSAPQQVVVNDLFEVVLQLEQAGTVAGEGVRFLTVLPPGVEFVSGSSTQGLVSESAGVVRCELGSVLPGLPATLTLRLRTGATREFRLDARVQSLSQEVTEQNNTQQIQISAVDFQILVDSAVVDEGAAGTSGAALFRVHFNVPRTEPVRLGFSTEDLSAAAGTDYQARTGEQVVPAGEVRADIAIPVLGDASYESDEEFRLRVTDLSSNQTRTAAGVGVIRNDDLPPLLEVQPARWVEGSRGASEVHFNVRLTGDTHLPVRFRHLLESGTARAGSDFAGGTGVMELPPGVVEGRVVLTLHGDTVFEGEELMLLRLADAEGCRLASDSVRGVIADDDPPAGVPARFSVTPAGDPLEPGRPFGLTVTALDAAGQVLEGFDGTLAITARRGSGVPSRMVISELLAGTRDQTDFVELLNVGVDPVDLSGWRVLLFGPATWPEPTVTLLLRSPLVLESGRSVVLNDFLNPASTVFQAFVLSQHLWAPEVSDAFFGGPLVAVVLEDRGGFTEDSFLAGRASSGFLQAILGPSGVRWDGPAVELPGAAPHAIQRVGGRNSRAAEDWTVGLHPNPGGIGVRLDPRFEDAVAIPMSPGALSGFSAGRWTGTVLMPDPVSGVAFYVEDGNGHSGRSDFLSSRSDLDQDGLPDAWEIDFGLSYRDSKDAAGNGDGDAYTALQEWVAGTDPRDRASALRLVLRGRRLEWVASAGRRYRLEQSDLGAGGGWTLRKSWEPGEGGLISEDLGDAGGSDNHLFRVLVEVP